MGQTRRRYPVLEVAIRRFSSAPLASGHERGLEGDLVVARPPTNGIGLLEMWPYLWLRVEGPEEAALGSLTMPLRIDAGQFERHRYQIPFSRLAQLVSGFDPDLARTHTQWYQPFLGADAETGLYLYLVPPLTIDGLVYDVLDGGYL